MERTTGALSAEPVPGTIRLRQPQECWQEVVVLAVVPTVQRSYRSNASVASPAARQLRSEWLVDECSHVLALWNGQGGQAAHGIRYAEELGRPVLNLWSSWAKYAGI